MGNTMKERRNGKKILKVILIIIGIIIIGAVILDAFLIVKPQIEAKKEISDTANYAMTPELLGY